MEAAEAVAYARRMRQASPLVHCFSNYVAMDLMANALLASGASPAMVHSPDECADFTRISSALLVNMGTYSPAWAESMRQSIGAANEVGKPWVLDPVGCGATPARTRVITELAGLKPTVIRGNASEVMSLAAAVVGPTASTGAGGKGVDSTNTWAEALPAAKALATSLGTVVAVTGALDFATDGVFVAYVGNGHPLCTKVTAAGCALTALVAAFLAARPPGVVATSRETCVAAAGAMSFFGLAAEVAYAELATAVKDKLATLELICDGERPSVSSTVGPASLRVRLVDSLHRLSCCVASVEGDSDTAGSGWRRVRVTSDEAVARGWAQECRA